MPACESKLVSRSSRKATVAKTVLIGQAQVLRSYAKGAERWLCVEQSRELFSDIRGRGGASNACFHS